MSVGARSSLWSGDASGPLALARAASRVWLADIPDIIQEAPAPSVERDRDEPRGFLLAAGSGSSTAPCRELRTAGHGA